MLNGNYATLGDFVAKLTEVLDGFSEELAELGIELREKMQAMVTGISIVTGTDSDNSISYGNSIEYIIDRVLQTRDFGPNDELSFTKGDVISFVNPAPNSILVKVSPNNVDLSAAQFVLFDSQNKDYIEDGVFSVSAKEYEGGLLTRAVGSSGLWEITLTLDDNRTDFPADGALLSLGIVNNMVDAAAADRIVSTDLVVTAGTRPVPYGYGVIYYSHLNNDWCVYNVDGVAIRSVSNSGPNQQWDPYPMIDDNPASAQYGDVKAGHGIVGNNMDDRSAIAYEIYEIDGTSSFDITTVSDAINCVRFQAYYVDFKDGAPTASTPDDDWGQINQLRKRDGEVGETIPDPVTIKIPDNKALHREIVEFNVQGVTVEGTLVDPDGVWFTVGLVAPDYTADALEVGLEVDEDFATTPQATYTSAEIDFNIADLGFTAEFMAGLTPFYRIDLISGTSWLEYDDDLDGIMQVFVADETDLVDGGAWVNVESAQTIDWAAVTKMRFIINSGAFVAEGEYTGSLVLTEDVATTIAGIANSVDATAAPAITLTFPIEITISEIPTVTP